MKIELTLYWPSATRTTLNFLEQEHLDTWCLICVNTKCTAKAQTKLKVHTTHRVIQTLSTSGIGLVYM